MKRTGQDAVIAGGLLLLLAALTIAAALVAAPAKKKEPALSSFSYQSDGAKGLSLWLQDLGFQVEQATVSAFEVPDDIDVVLLLRPSVAFTAAEQVKLWNWVFAGGHLVVAGSSVPAEQVLDIFNLQLAPLTEPSEWWYLQTPALQTPPVEKPVHADARYGFRDDYSQVKVHTAAEGIPTTVSLEWGDGTVVATTADFPFSNAGITDSGNAQFIYNLIVYPGKNRVVWFDEWHHGIRAQPLGRIGPMYWLFDSAAGRGVIFALAVIWIGLLLAGRPFGRPLRSAAEEQHRPAVEYVGAIARLRRRAGQRRAALDHYRHALKKGLGARYPLDPAQNDGRFVEELQTYRPDLDAPRLKKLLRRLSGKRVSERELVNLAGEVADWVDRD